MLNWDEEYKSGKWDYLEKNPDEFGRYAIISEYIGLIQSPKILDVGCGQGGIAKRLMYRNVMSYIGFDTSLTAVNTAKKSNHKANKFTFLNSTVEEFKTQDKFNIIILGELLYYFLNPVDILFKYANFLDANGYLIVSLYQMELDYFPPLNTAVSTKKIWSDIEKNFEIHHAYSLKSHSTQNAWDIALLKPRNN